jgi:hypothetical protein|nr:MAG TPA: hypothetical protein [Bacteriophage sp.]
MDHVDEITRIADEGYREIARALRDVFKSEQGCRALEGLYQLFCHSYFDPSCPKERALYQQGQASVIYEIKDMINKIEKGLL